LRNRLTVIWRLLVTMNDLNGQTDRAYFSPDATVPDEQSKQSLSCVLFFCLFSLIPLTSAAQEENRPLAIEHSITRIMTADHGSGTFKSADELATMFNWRHMSGGLFDSAGSLQPALAISSAGPLDSLAKVISNRAEFAIVRADLADSVFESSDDPRFKGRHNLRLVSTHYPSMLHIVVRSDFKGKLVSDLNGKRINISGEDAATLSHAGSILKMYGLDAARYTPVYAPTADAIRRLKAGTVDVVMFFDQAPSTLISEDIEQGILRFVNLKNSEPDSISSMSRIEFPSAKKSYFVKIASGEYYKNTENVWALLTPTYLLTRNDASPDAVDSVIELLNATPIISNPASNNDAAPEDLAQSRSNKSKPGDNKQTTEPVYQALMHHEAHKISPDFSPIPLHSGAQILMDIFTDLQFSESFTAEDTVKAEKSDE